MADLLTRTVFFKKMRCPWQHASAMYHTVHYSRIIFKRFVYFGSLLQTMPYSNCHTSSYFPLAKCRVIFLASPTVELELTCTLGNGKLCSWQLCFSAMKVPLLDLVMLKRKLWLWLVDSWDDFCAQRCTTEWSLYLTPVPSLCCRIVTGNNTNNKSESDQEDNDDVNDNDWSYGAEKKGNLLVLLFISALFLMEGLSVT